MIRNYVDELRAEAQANMEAAEEASETRKHMVHRFINQFETFVQLLRELEKRGAMSLLHGKVHVTGWGNQPNTLTDAGYRTQLVKVVFGHEEVNAFIVAADLAAENLVFDGVAKNAIGKDTLNFTLESAELVNDAFLRWLSEMKIVFPPATLPE